LKGFYIGMQISIRPRAGSAGILPAEACVSTLSSEAPSLDVEI
jgi:hypothetical protein